MLHFPCAAGMGSVVEVGTAFRHGFLFIIASTQRHNFLWKYSVILILSFLHKNLLSTLDSRTKLTINCCSVVVAKKQTNKI